jgi:ActR/RegA family two-component response regulator
LKRENVSAPGHRRASLVRPKPRPRAVIDSALDGVLLDEAYALVATGAKNDFGLVAIDTLLTRMSDRDRLVVIIAGYARIWTAS